LAGWSLTFWTFEQRLSAVQAQLDALKAAGDMKPRNWYDETYTVDWDIPAGRSGPITFPPAGFSGYMIISGPGSNHQALLAIRTDSAGFLYVNNLDHNNYLYNSLNI